MSTIDFGRLADDYQFFLAHSTETDAQLEALRPHMEWLAQSGRAVSMLDFGCGTGAFLERLLTHSPIPNLTLSCVEPVVEQRTAAIKRLSAHVTAIRDNAHPFDFILANHSLYYVADPATQVKRLTDQLSRSGRLVIALLHRDNLLAELWQAGYRLSGKPFPFELADDVEKALSNLGLSSQREPISYKIAFRDTQKNRAHVVRFLFGQDMEVLGQSRLIELFDQFSAGGEISFETTYPHLVVAGGCAKLSARPDAR